MRLLWSKTACRAAATVGAGVIAFGAIAQPTTTILTHGLSAGAKGVWVEGMAEAILWRAGEGSAFRYSGATGQWNYINTVNGDGTMDVVVLIFNWVEESDGPGVGPNWNYVQAAGDALYAALRDPSYSAIAGPDELVAGRVVHFIGHSRGACVNSEAIARLALEGLPVDQVTTHDPHPVNGTLDPPLNFNWGDPVPQKWVNIAWADNYWRADGGGFDALDFDGMPLTNFENVQLNEAALERHAYQYSHSDVHLWYHGTIDVRATAFDGEETITAAVRTDWWPLGDWATRGYFFSALGGGENQRSNQPQGIAPSPRPALLHGDFPQGSYAGWLYHGGGWTGNAQPIVSDAGNWFAILGLRGGGVITSIRHNRSFLAQPLHAIEFDYRIVDPDNEVRDDRIRFSLIDAEGAIHEIGELSLAVDQPTGWLHGAVIAQADVDTGTHQLLIEHVSGSGAQSTVWLDNITLVLMSPANLTDFAITFGSRLSGDLQDLINSDDAHLRTRSQFGFIATEPNLIQVEIGATSAVQSPTSMNLTVEGRINQPGGTVRLRHKNWNTNAFEQVHIYAIGTTEVVETVEDIAAANYIRTSDGRIELSMRTWVMAVFSPQGFDQFTDQVGIEVR